MMTGKKVEVQSMIINSKLSYRVFRQLSDLADMSDLLTF